MSKVINIAIIFGLFFLLGCNSISENEEEKEQKVIEMDKKLTEYGESLELVVKSETDRVKEECRVDYEKNLKLLINEMKEDQELSETN